jgi:hypothetical protein
MFGVSPWPGAVRRIRNCGIPQGDCVVVGLGRVTFFPWRAASLNGANRAQICCWNTYDHLSVAARFSPLVEPSGIEPSTL